MISQILLFEFWGSHLEPAVAQLTMKLAIITTISFAKPALTKFFFLNKFNKTDGLKKRNHTIEKVFVTETSITITCNNWIIY